MSAHSADGGVNQQKQQQTPEDHVRPLVLILRPMLAKYEASLSARFRLLKPFESPLPRHEFLAAHASSIRAVISNFGAPVNAELLDLLPCLGLVITPSRGVDHIDIPECTRRGIAVATAGHIFTDDVADFAVGLLIDVLRRVSAADRYVRGGLWSKEGDYPLGFRLGGKKIGIVGLGSIGSEVAKRLEAFGCIISYNSQRQKPCVSYKFFQNVCDLAAESDVLIVSCALTRETHHIINKEVLEALGEQGVIINIGRGELIDEKELVMCLVDGKIGGAGLDVFANEPGAPNELFQLDNVVLTPHVAVCTTDSLSALLEDVIANLEAFFSNRPLHSLVSG